MEWNGELLRDIVAWDVSTWQKAIFCWDAYIDAHLPNCEHLQVLEIGARGGGVSLYFAQKGFRVACSDCGDRFEEAQALHARYGVTSAITYIDADCTALPFEAETFDAVAFKSVLGSIGKNKQDEKIVAAMAEIERVLKPGGTLFFAENLEATPFHLYLRRKVNRWGAAWNYVSLPRMAELLSNFSPVELHTYGFWGCFLKDHPITRTADRWMCRKSPSHRHYMCYGVAKKP